MIRKRLEELEERTLQKGACLASASRGRLKPQEESPSRTCFMRDRDSIIHSKAFRRLKHKTQVFLSPEGDHYRTRLTHTLEVSQISRTVARGLRLNEDLTEAIALGHDLGHTAFGHAGERALGEVVPGGFAVIDSALVDRRTDRTDITAVYIPATRIAHENGIAKLANLIMLGALYKASGFTTMEALRAGVEKVVPPSKKELVELNMKAIHIGMEYQP